MAKQFDRRGNVVAHDTKYTGEESVWTGELTQEDFMSRRSVMLGFYNYYLDKKALLPDADEWIKRCMSAVKLPQSIMQNELSFTVLKLMRANNRGMALVTEDTNDFEMIETAVARAQVIAKKAAEDAKQKAKEKDAAVAVTPLTSAADAQVNEVLCDLEEMYDKWVVEKTNKPVGVNLGDICKNLKIKKTGQFVDWLDKNIDELTRALNKEDEFAIEGYSFLNKPSLRKWIKALEDMKASLKITRKAKKGGKPRAKKVKTPGEQTKHLKSAEKDEDTGVEALPVSSIIGAQTVVLYNTKYRDVNVLKCKSGEGFTVKGQAVQGVAEKASYGVKLRKPEEDLQPLKDAKNPDKYIKVLTAKPKGFNIRFNDNVMVIYAK